MANIKYRQELLQQVAAGINACDRTRIQDVEVVVSTDDEKYTFTLSGFLDVLANDLYWDERGNWADARIATVQTF